MGFTLNFLDWTCLIVEYQGTRVLLLSTGHCKGIHEPYTWVKNSFFISNSLGVMGGVNLNGCYRKFYYYLNIARITEDILLLKCA